MRRFCGDYHLLKERPGHYFLNYELADLVTFLDLVIQFGWGAYVLPAGGRFVAFISHDEWVLVQADRDLEAIVCAFETVDIHLESMSAESD